MSVRTRRRAALPSVPLAIRSPSSSHVRTCSSLMFGIARRRLAAASGAAKDGLPIGVLSPEQVRAIPVFRIEDTDAAPLPESDYASTHLPPPFEVARACGIDVR